MLSSMHQGDGMDIFQILDGLCVSMGNTLGGIIYERAMDIPGQKIPGVLESHIHSLEMLNTVDIGAYSMSSGLASNEYHFLNLRAGIIIEGKKCYERVLCGEHQAMEECRGLTGMMFRLDEVIKDSLCLAYFEKTDGDLLRDMGSFTDGRFISHIRNKAYTNTLKSDGHEQELRLLTGGAKVVESVSIPRLGRIGRGSLLRHKKFGICWIYNVLQGANGDIQFEALFKSSLKNILWHDGGIWLPCADEAA